MSTVNRRLYHKGDVWAFETRVFGGRSSGFSVSHTLRDDALHAHRMIVEMQETA